MRSPFDLSTAIEARKNDQRYRTLRSILPLQGIEIKLDGKTMLNFSSNDYLGLSQHAFLKEKAIKYISRYGVGTGFVSFGLRQY